MTPEASEGAAPSRAPREIPALLIRSGRVYSPGPDGPAEIHGSTGAPIDAFDAFDRLTPTYRRIYIADLNGIQRGEPQLDLWQELAREADLWIDGGVQTADQSIDILVSGARRAVLSTARLKGLRELKKAWALSQELAVEIEVQGGRVPYGDPDWKGHDAIEVAQQVRAIGPNIVILSPRGEDIDWGLVRQVSAAGTTYVDGSYPLGALSDLVGAGARGGIFYPAPSTPTDGGKI
jgi:hypothetical protein